MTDEWEIEDGRLWHKHGETESISACMAWVTKRGPEEPSCSYCGAQPPEEMMDVCLLGNIKYKSDFYVV